MFTNNFYFTRFSKLSIISEVQQFQHDARNGILDCFCSSFFRFVQHRSALIGWHFALKLEKFSKKPVLQKLQPISSALQSNPYKMFAATLQPSWPSRPKTNVILLFYFLKLYNLDFYEIFVGSTSSELQHPWISKIRCEPKKSRKNNFSGSILKYFWSIDLYEISHGLCNLLEFKFVNL